MTSLLCASKAAAERLQAKQPIQACVLISAAPLALAEEPLTCTRLCRPTLPTCTLPHKLPPLISTQYQAMPCNLVWLSPTTSTLHYIQCSSVEGGVVYCSVHLVRWVIVFFFLVCHSRQFSRCTVLQDSAPITIYYAEQQGGGTDCLLTPSTTDGLLAPSTNDGFMR